MEAKCNNQINKVVNKMFCLLLCEIVVHITDRVLIERKTIKYFVNEHELQINASYFFFVTVLVITFMY